MADYKTKEHKPLNNDKDQQLKDYKFRHTKTY